MVDALPDIGLLQRLMQHFRREWSMTCSSAVLQFVDHDLAVLFLFEQPLDTSRCCATRSGSAPPQIAMPHTAQNHQQRKAAGSACPLLKL